MSASINNREITQQPDQSWSFWSVVLATLSGAIIQIIGFAQVIRRDHQNTHEIFPAANIWWLLCMVISPMVMVVILRKLNQRRPILITTFTYLVPVILLGISNNLGVAWGMFGYPWMFLGATMLALLVALLSSIVLKP